MSRSKDFADLRQKAEVLVRQRAAQTTEYYEALSLEEIRGKLHELRVHQIELEMQNEELRTAQAEIETGRARYFDLYDLAPVGYCNMSKKGLILEANLTAATLLGTNRGDLIKQPISRFIRKEDQYLYYLHRKKLFETGEPQECELRMVKSDGAFFWAHLAASAAQTEDGAPVCRVVLSDITERKQAEEALRKSDSIKNTMVSNIGDVIVIIDQNGIIQYKSPTVTKLFGWKPEELVGNSIWDNVHTDDLAPGKNFMGSLLEEPNKTGTTEVRYKRKDGRYCIIQFTGVNLFHDPDINGILGNYHDITDRKKAEEEQEKLQAQFNQAQKMESVGRLAGGVAHDFNNMLGVILGHVDMILEGMDPGQPFHANLAEIRKAGQRSADLTRQLLAFARKQTVAPKVFDLNIAIENMLKMLRRLIGEDIELLWKPGHGLWPVRMDPAQIDQILANLCVNARDAIADIGNVTIETENVVFDVGYCKEQAGFVPGEYTLLAVSDNGCGMDAEMLENIFEPFFTTKELHQGSGLGLATVYGAVRQNKGFVDVYSEPGQGTTFKIYLPRHTNQATETKKPRPQVAEFGSETILLVEDEPAILRMTTMMLEQAGYQVLAAITPGEAIALAREYTGDINLLITDVIMPEMNGRDLAQNLLSLYPNLNRLFMSGYTANMIAHHGVLDEGVHFIQKPFSKTDLGAKVRAVLDC